MDANESTKVASIVITKSDGAYEASISIKGMKLKLYNADRIVLLKEASKTIMELLK